MSIILLSFCLSNVLKCSWTPYSLPSWKICYLFYKYIVLVIPLLQKKVIRSLLPIIGRSFYGTLPQHSDLQPRLGVRASLYLRSYLTQRSIEKPILDF